MNVEWTSSEFWVNFEWTFTRSSLQVHSLRFIRSSLQSSLVWMNSAPKWNKRGSAWSYISYRIITYGLPWNVDNMQRKIMARIGAGNGTAVNAMTNTPKWWREDNTHVMVLNIRYNTQVSCLLSSDNTLSLFDLKIYEPLPGEPCPHFRLIYVGKPLR